jgi:methanogenic corrinoid protein MtbC1
VAVATLRRVVQEAQREVGRLWQLNHISVAQEHMATSIAQVVLSHLYEHASPEPPNGKRVLLACVEREQHELPARLVADALELGGFEVRYLGANVPTDSLLILAHHEQPDLLALSVTLSLNVPALREAVRQLRARLGPRLPLLVGGHALRWVPGLAAELGVEGYGVDAEEALTAARRILEVKTP